MTHRDALRIPVELQHHKFSLIVRSKSATFLLVQVLAVASAFQPIGQCNGRVAAFDFQHSGLVLASNSEDTFKDLPRVLFDLLVAEAHAAVFLVQLEHHHFNLVSDIAEFRWVLDFLGPAEVRDVDKAVDAFLQLDEQAEVGEVADLAFLL